MTFPKSLTIRGKQFDFSQRTYVMGVLNVTPDSFSDGGLFMDPPQALAQAEKLLRDGADILDIGGESTRPGANPVPFEEEKKRVIPVIQAVRERFPHAILSIDTQKAVVALAAHEAGVDMVNDVSALSADPRMAAVVGERDVPLILMHMKGDPQTMQISPVYSDLLQEILAGLQRAKDAAIKAGVSAEKIFLDPGIGFGKRLEHNMEIFRRLSELAVLGSPIVIGPSRKSMIGALLNGAPADDRLEGTLGAVVAAVARGAHVVRVHDVLRVVRALKVADPLLREDFVKEPA